MNWLSTCDETLSEAMTAAVDCFAGFIYTSKKTNEPCALPSEISDIQLDKIAMDLNISIDNAFVNMVTVDVELYAKEHFDKSVKKTLSIPAWLNKAAMERDINFSQTLQEALIKKISL